MTHPHVRPVNIRNTTLYIYYDILKAALLEHIFHILKILQCANEGLKYLDERKDFWQQQKPVYARRNEMFTHQKSKQFHKKLTVSMNYDHKPSLTVRRNALPS